MNKIRIVVDTNILVSSVFWSGNPYELIHKGIEGEILIFTSEDSTNTKRKQNQNNQKQINILHLK